MFFFFFFQAEDGIRDYKVTGVQTCALPICSARGTAASSWRRIMQQNEMIRPLPRRRARGIARLPERYYHCVMELVSFKLPAALRRRVAAEAEERRVGKE